MANVLYASGKQLFLQGDRDWLTEAFKINLIDVADHAFNAANDNLNDITGAAIVATSPNLSGKTATGGVADCTDPVFTAVTGDQSEAFNVYHDSGSATTSSLICYIDTATSGLPFTPNGGDLTLQINAAGLFEV